MDNPTQPKDDPFDIGTVGDVRPDCTAPGCLLSAARFDDDLRLKALDPGGYSDGYARCPQCKQPLCFAHFTMTVDEAQPDTHACPAPDGVLKTKKDEIIQLYEAGTKDIAEIVRRVKARPSYVAQVLQQAGHLDGYFDLYTTTSAEKNVYTRYFRNVLAFRTVEAARESVARIDRLYNYFERLGDHAGQHQATVVALTGKNRARWSGKPEEAAIFDAWLKEH